MQPMREGKSQVPWLCSKAEWYQFRYEDLPPGRRATAEEVKGYVRKRRQSVKNSLSKALPGLSILLPLAMNWNCRS